MTTIQLDFKNLSDSNILSALFPTSNDFEFTENKVFRRKTRINCTCGEQMIHNGYNYACKKGLGKVRIGKQLCSNCGKQYQEDKAFWNELLTDWSETISSLILTLRDAHVSWDVISKIMNFIIPFGKTKAIDLFKQRVEQFKYPQDNYLIVNYDEQHPKKGRMQKFRLTLLNYQTKIPIADCLFDDKKDDTIKAFLEEHLDTSKELIIITDCDRRYPQIFKDLWGNKVIHQKCLMHLNKLVVSDFGKTKTVLDEYNKYLMLNIFYNRDKELKFLEKILKRKSHQSFESEKEQNNWEFNQIHIFREFVKQTENARRRKSGKKTLTQRTLKEAKQLFEQLHFQNQLLPKNVRSRLTMIKKNWKFFTAFYAVKDCPATNNSIENFYSTSLKTHRKKQLRTNKGLLNHMKLAAIKRVKAFADPKATLLEIYGKIGLISI